MSGGDFREEISKRADQTLGHQLVVDVIDELLTNLGVSKTGLPASTPPALCRPAAAADRTESREPPVKNTTTAYCGARECTKPSPSHALCRDHSLELWRVLALLPDRLADLDTTRTKQHRFSRGGGRRSKAHEAPLPFDNRVGRITAEAKTILTRWQARLADHYGQPVRFPKPAAAAYWMLGTIAYDHRNRLATYVDAGPMLHDLQDLLAKIDRIIDRPKHLDAWFAGRCSVRLEDGTECQEVLYADPGAGAIVCRRCGYSHDVAYRRTVLLEHAEDTLVTATEAARAITVLTDYSAGQTRLVRRIAGWYARGQLSQRGSIEQAGKPRPMYRLGDIIDRLDHADNTPIRQPIRRASELDILTEGTPS